MSNFAARLDSLMDRATPRPWSAKYVGTAYPDHRYHYMPESERERRKAQRKGMYVAMFPADVDTDEPPYRDYRDIRLVEFLVNHAPAIRDLVRAAEKIDNRRDFFEHDADFIALSDSPR